MWERIEDQHADDPFARLTPAKLRPRCRKQRQQKCESRTPPKKLTFFAAAIESVADHAPRDGARVGTDPRSFQPLMLLLSRAVLTLTCGYFHVLF
jgi:hypothetical protein